MTRVFRTGRWHYVLAAAAVVALLLMFRGTFSYLAQQWQREEYSHGWMIPLLAAFLVWQRRREIESVAFTGSWSGVALVLAGMALYFIGALASITTIDAYALVIVIIGAALAWLGWRAFALVRVPLLLLFLMNPIPNFFYANLSSTLQLWSSRIGVGVIRLFGISVFLEGNVIDLGNYQLQVAEACSGLRYLFPLMTLGVIIGYLFRGRMWMRWFIVLSAAPITVLMNSFRIGVIGVLVDLYGTAQAEGFLHLFEGWVVFMLCFLLLLLECWILARLGGMRVGLRELFALEFPGPRPPNAVATIRTLTAPLPVAVILLLLVAWPAYALPSRPEQPPPRAGFSEFPARIGTWIGRRQGLEQIYLDTLQLDDYVLADYSGTAPGEADAGAINLYVAYYASQRGGRSAHSPRSCLPGGGWRIETFARHEIAMAGGQVPLRVNRVLIRQGDDRQLVYYWFQERSRDITSEYAVKWYLLVDALLRNRTDGALVRLVTAAPAGSDLAAADARLARFAATLRPVLEPYLPD